jgi:hypothetical protein
VSVHGEAVGARSVPAVSSFGKKIRPEGGELFRREQLIELARRRGVVQIVDPLRAFVAEPAVLLKA